ncbi:MAG: hypothetical protein ACXWF2_14120, partial [Usitatibacter sp.]
MNADNPKGRIESGANDRIVPIAIVPFISHLRCICVHLRFHSLSLASLFDPEFLAEPLRHHHQEEERE